MSDLTQQPPSIVDLEAHAFRLIALRLCLDAVTAERARGLHGRIIEGFEWDAIRWLATVCISETLRWAEYPVDDEDGEEEK